jgi:hypothetical protein
MRARWLPYIKSSVPKFYLFSASLCIYTVALSHKYASGINDVLSTAVMVAWRINVQTILQTSRPHRQHLAKTE